MKFIAIALLAFVTTACGTNNTTPATETGATNVSDTGALLAESSSSVTTAHNVFQSGWLYAGTLVHAGTLSNPSIVFQARNARYVGFEVSTLCAPRLQAGAVRIYDPWNGGYLQPITFVNQVQQGLVLRAVYQVQGMSNAVIDGLTATFTRFQPSNCAIRVYTKL